MVFANLIYLDSFNRYIVLGYYKALVFMRKIVDFYRADLDKKSIEKLNIREQ